jgi:hypothetical protein
MRVFRLASTSFTLLKVLPLGAACCSAFIGLFLRKAVGTKRAPSTDYT